MSREQRDNERFVIDKPLIEYSCIGSAIFPSMKRDSKFKVKQMPDGGLSGEVEFSETQSFVELFEIAKRAGVFNLEGTDTINGYIIRVKDCVFSSLRGGTPPVMGSFTTSEVIVKPESLEQKLTKSSIATFYVTNMYKTFS